MTMTTLNAQEIEDHLVSLRQDTRTRSPGELSRAENVAKEFFQVKISRTHLQGGGGGMDAIFGQFLYTFTKSQSQFFNHN